MSSKFQKEMLFNKEVYQPNKTEGRMKTRRRVDESDMEGLKNFTILGSSWRRCPIKTEECTEGGRGEGHVPGDQQDFQVALVQHVWRPLA